jgi:phenylacetate-coenzyme A ligase PaaK-like adenylate-forming protein
MLNLTCLISREHWQHKQQENLLLHAGQRSPFWRERIGASKVKGISLSDLPILTRSDVVKRVESEGSLLRGEPIATRKHATSGSSGMPVQFFVSEMNAHTMTSDLLRSSSWRGAKHHPSRDPQIN